jgi:predicted alpha-1,2-mannosidase
MPTRLTILKTDITMFFKTLINSRFQCPKGFVKPTNIDLYRDAAKDYNVDKITSTTMAGHRFSKGWANDQKAFFFAEFSQPVTVKPLGTGRWLITAADVTKPLLVKTGMSAVSAENAQLNLQKEIPGWDFRQVVADADEAWNKELAKVNIETNDSVSRRIFYTAMYHSMTAPSVFSDVNGQYRGADGKVHDGNFTNYTTLSLWDTYRAAHPLMTMIHTDMLPDMASTFINIYRQQGQLPVWHLMGNETNCMVGNPGIPVLADMVLKGYVKDKEGAYEALKQSALREDRGLGLLKKYGYLPYDKEKTKETVAKGLEYALADACVAKVARMLGKKEDAKYFEKRSKSYSKYFDKETGFMRGIGSDGKFRTPFNPFAAEHRDDDYTEGNAWQYTWLVPHDVHGLIKLFGNEQKFVTKLDSLFIVTGNMGDNASPDISGLIGQYAHGNEPSHQVLYMYNYVGQPWKGARLLRQTMDEMYKDDFDGLSGNEDVGQMSAWYILSSVGLYQVEPAGGKYIIGSPIFNKASLNVGKSKTFSIICKDNSKENMYIQHAKLNGKPYTKSYIMYNDIMKGGTLELQMGSQPSKWGTRPADRP